MTPSNLADAGSGRTGIQVADLPPPLRLLPTDDGADEAPPAPPPKRKLPKHLYFPSPAMKTIWCRFSIGGLLYRRSTGCRDVRNAERRAHAIRAEIEAEARGIAAPKRVMLADAIRDFGRHIAAGRGGVDRQVKTVRLLHAVLGPKPVRFVDELSLDIYDAFVARVKKPTKRCPKGFTQATIHCYAQVIRRFGKWLEDTDRVHKSPFRQVPLDTGGNNGKRRRALSFEDFEALLAATRHRPIEDARRIRIHKGVTDREIVRLRRIGRRRALVLRTIARSGIRPGELRQVWVGLFDPDTGTIFLPAEIAKARRPEVVYLTPDLTRRLAALIRSMGPGNEDRLLFPEEIPGWRTIDRDIEAAGLAKEDRRGRTLSLYSMRKSFSTHLRMCGVDDDMVGRLMRHSGTSLNSNTYTDEDLLDLREPDDAPPLPCHHDPPAAGSPPIEADDPDHSRQERPPEDDGKQHAEHPTRRPWLPRSSAQTDRRPSSRQRRSRLVGILGATPPPTMKPRTTLAAVLLAVPRGRASWRGSGPSR